MTNTAQGIQRALVEALEFAQGTPRAAEFQAHIPDEIDIQRIRRKLNMSQAQFSQSFGIKLGTLRDWEQGRRVPDTSARALLKVIDKEPDAVARALAS